jgi:hypothetical protein
MTPSHSPGDVRPDRLTAIHFRCQTRSGPAQGRNALGGSARSPVCYGVNRHGRVRGVGSTPPLTCAVRTAKALQKLDGDTCHVARTTITSKRTAVHFAFGQQLSCTVCNLNSSFSADWVLSEDGSSLRRSARTKRTDRNSDETDHEAAIMKESLGKTESPRNIETQSARSVSLPPLHLFSYRFPSRFPRGFARK